MDYMAIKDNEFNWAKSVYGDMSEVVPTNASEPLSKYVTLTHNIDANLYHDMLTGCSITGILHFLKKMPIDWYSKKQATVKTVIYGSKYIAARVCIDHIVDLRLTLCYLGIPIWEKSYMFGNNKTIIDSSTTPHAKLHKRHNALSIHHVREAVASKFIGFIHLPGEFNPANILSKHWGYPQVWCILKALLFYHGDMANLYEGD